MKLNNGAELEIHKTWYNKTRVQEDGVTHITDPTPYTVYQFGMAKNYFDIEERVDVVDAIIADLKTTIQQLEKMKQKDLSENREDNSR